MRTWFMSAHSGTPMVRTKSAAFTSLSMEEHIGSAFSIWGGRSAFQILRCALLPRISCLPARGIRGVHRGLRMLRSTDRVADFTGPRMRGKRGLVSRETGCPRAIGDELES